MENFQNSGDRDFLIFAEKWESLPKGWTEQSAKDFWDSLTGEVKHKVTKCIKEMEGNVDDPGAFCGSLADLVDPGWRNRKARVAAQESLFKPWLGKKEPLIPLIFKKIKDQQKERDDIGLRSFQAGINGFIYNLFDDFIGGKILAQKLWTLFEGSGISQDTYIGKEVFYYFERYFTGSSSLRLLQAAAVALELLRRGRMPRLAAKAEALFLANLKDEMKKEQPIAPAGKGKTPTQVLKELVTERLPKAKEYLANAQHAGFPISVDLARTLVAEALEDSNWPSLSSKIRSMTTDELQDLPGALYNPISKDEGWAVNYLAVMGIAILSLVKDKEGIAVLKKALLSEFPDTLQEDEE
jgi:hypothetical protein